MIVPLLATIVAVSVFFGWALMHKHQVVVADRYSIWRKTQAGSWPSEEQINDICFMGRAQTVSLSSLGGISDTLDELSLYAGQQGAGAQLIVEEVLADRLPAGRRARVSAIFNHNMEIFTRTSGRIRHHSGREGPCWMRSNANPWPGFRDIYYEEMDTGLTSVPAPADGMAQMVRGLYIARW